MWASAIELSESLARAEISVGSDGLGGSKATVGAAGSKRRCAVAALDGSALPAASHSHTVSTDRRPAAPSAAQASIRAIRGARAIHRAVRRERGALTSGITQAVA